jgi:hypothetical protein
MPLKLTDNVELTRRIANLPKENSGNPTGTADAVENLFVNHHPYDILFAVTCAFQNRAQVTDRESREGILWNDTSNVLFDALMKMAEVGQF